MGSTDVHRQWNKNVHLYIRPVSQKCSSADTLCLFCPLNNSSWIFVHLRASTAAEIDPVKVLLIHKPESIRHIVGDQREWEINYSYWYFVALPIRAHLLRSNSLSRHTQSITGVDATPQKLCAIKHPCTMQTPALHHRNRTTGSRGEKPNIK